MTDITPSCSLTKSSTIAVMLSNSSITSEAGRVLTGLATALTFDLVLDLASVGSGLEIASVGTLVADSILGAVGLTEVFLDLLDFDLDAAGLDFALALDSGWELAGALVCSSSLECSSLPLASTVWAMVVLAFKDLIMLRQDSNSWAVISDLALIDSRD